MQVGCARAGHAWMVSRIHPFAPFEALPIRVWGALDIDYHLLVVDGDRMSARCHPLTYMESVFTWWYGT